jgi:DNA repair protein RadA
MAEAQGLPVDEVKKHVFYSRVIGTADLIATIEEGHKLVKKYGLKFIGVDTLVNPFRAEYPGREMLPERQYRINRCLRRLLDYARAFDLAVLVTNQVHAAPVATSIYESRPEILNPPTGGHVFSYAVNSHLYMSRTAKQGVFLAVLIDSSYLPRSEARYTITEKGISDVEVKKGEREGK